MIPIYSKDTIDDVVLYKYSAASKMQKVLSFIDDQKSKKLVKTASNVDPNALINLFAQMLSSLNLKVDQDSVKEVLGNLSNNMEKTSAIKKIGKERKEEIKIVSKNIKDSHFQVDISKDIVSKDDKKVFMVSCFAKDDYLGRYLIKRNFFFTSDREEFADSAYDEILTKMSAIKDRYYNGIIDVASINVQFKKILDGVISEIKSEEDSLPTNVKR